MIISYAHNSRLINFRSYTMVGPGNRVRQEAEDKLSLFRKKKISLTLIGMLLEKRKIQFYINFIIQTYFTDVIERWSISVPNTSFCSTLLKTY